MSTAWREHYARALAFGDSWTDRVADGDRVFVGSACGEPTRLIAQLGDRVRRGMLRPLTAYQMVMPGSRHLLGRAGPNMHVVGMTFEPGLAPLADLGYASFLPRGIYDIGRSLADGSLAFDVVLIQVAPPDDRGYLSLGVSVDFALDAVRHGRLIVAECNPRMPRAVGDCLVHVSEVDAIVESSYELAEVTFGAPTEIDRRIGRNVCELIPDHATIEVGAGALMTAILEPLRERSGLGIHTGLLTDAMVDLLDSGAVDNEWKGVDPGVSVANQCRGTRCLYDYIDGNQAVSMRPATYTHDPRVLASLRGFRAVNTAIEIDLLGRVNSEFVDGRRVSSVGGLADFVVSAQATEGARSIIAIKSTARSGRVSRIVAELGAQPTLAADLADLVVTEHGIADLRGRSTEQRAAALIRIAADEFRDELEWSHARPEARG